MPSFHIYRNDKNQGVGFTKRRCVDLAKGEICGFVDPDDALTENAIEISVKAYNENYIATYSQFYLCDENLNIQNIFKRTKKIKNKNPLFFNTEFEVAHFFTFKKEAYQKTEGIKSEPYLWSARKCKIQSICVCSYYSAA
jgi:glycosyltransferase involved in cell wall biosynthesis